MVCISTSVVCVSVSVVFISIFVSVPMKDEFRLIDLCATVLAYMLDMFGQCLLWNVVVITASHTNTHFMLLMTRCRVDFIFLTMINCITSLSAVFT